MFGENLDSPILGPNLPFLARYQHFSLYLPSDYLNFADFWYRNYLYGLLLKKIKVYCPGKCSQAHFECISLISIKIEATFL